MSLVRSAAAAKYFDSAVRVARHPPLPDPPHDLTVLKGVTAIKAGALIQLFVAFGRSVA